MSANNTASVRQERLDGFRVLLVEDEFLVAMTVSDILADLGCDVVGPVSRLAKATRIITEESFDGAILDINLDGQKIDPVARALRDRGVPFILVTGYGESAVAEDLRAEPRLNKPFNAERLEELAIKVFARI